MPRLFCFHMVRSHNTLKEQSLVIILMTKVLESGFAFYDVIYSTETSIKGDKKCINLFSQLIMQRIKSLEQQHFISRFILIKNMINFLNVPKINEGRNLYCFPTLIKLLKHTPNVKKYSADIVCIVLAIFQLILAILTNTGLLTLFEY